MKIVRFKTGSVLANQITLIQIDPYVNTKILVRLKQDRNPMILSFSSESEALQWFQDATNVWEKSFEEIKK